MSVFGGLDLCLFPAGTPPDGVKSNFTNPPTYAPVVIAVTVVVLFFASLFTGCRLLANWKKLTWTDHCNTLALIFSLAQSGLMLAHMFGTSGTYQRVGFSEIMPNQQMMLVPGLIFSKVSLFLLFLQIFDIRDGMRLAIRIGIAATLIIYFPSFPMAGYYQAPSPGQSWENVMITGRPQNGIYWGIVQSALGILLDLYMFVLPLPIITQLHISKTKRNQLVLVFSTAFISEVRGVVANILSLVYRVIEYKNMKDATWFLYVLLLCTVVELNIAIIVCSVPGLAKFFRTYAADWTPIETLRSKFFSPGNSSNSSGSNLYNKHGWPAARQAEQKLDPHVESATSQSTSASLHRGGIDESHEYVDLQERWQIDPYLDTRGPEYSWMYMENEMNGVSTGRSSQEKVHAFQSGQGA
ncbi:hypothetical protein N8I77_011314 [Diaporthe amygdali]|uniref:Rhodopsin domain-containing protein n=1 Tax=Phomopsis amygdali TaxID=1214568 RepID=A0AAD9S844_PHOAM|nr:hypothetical protein N8I77_011314 [Diaporthe amygdali]